MRIGDRLKFELFKTNIGSLKEKIDANQEMIASQKKVVKPSDDAVAFSAIMEMEGEKRLNGQFKRNVDRLNMVAGTIETSFDTIHTLLTRAKAVAVTQASSTMDASTRQYSSEEIKGIMEQLVTLGNTKVSGAYVFGGKNAETVPFVLNDLDYSVTFQGTDDVPTVFVDSGEKEKMGMSGRDVFYNQGGYSIFDTLKTFKEALENNDVAAIKTAIDDLDTGLRLTENNIAYVGTYAEKLESIVSSQDAKNLRFDQNISEMADADMVSLISDFNTLSDAYQAAIYSMTRLRELSILNYLS